LAMMAVLGDQDARVVAGRVVAQIVQQRSRANTARLL
jgi:hypothetical protein